MTIRQSQAKGSSISGAAKALWQGPMWKLNQSPSARAPQVPGRTHTRSHIVSWKPAMYHGRRVLDIMMRPGKMHQGDIGNGNGHEIVKNGHEIGNGNGNGNAIETGIVIGTENGTENGTGIETGNASVIGKGNDRPAPKSILRYLHAPWRTMIQSIPCDPWLRATAGSRRGPGPTAMGSPYRHHTSYAPPTLKMSTIHIRRDARNASESAMPKKRSERRPLAVCGVSSREYLPSLVAFEWRFRRNDG